MKERATRCIKADRVGDGEKLINKALKLIDVGLNYLEGIKLKTPLIKQLKTKLKENRIPLKKLLSDLNESLAIEYYNKAKKALDEELDKRKARRFLDQAWRIIRGKKWDVVKKIKKRRNKHKIKSN